jgi:hypothetical protein
MEVLDRERRREEVIAREQNEDELLKWLQPAVQWRSGVAPARSKLAQRSRRYRALLKRSAQRAALTEAHLERERIFRRLAERWRSETGLLSSIEDKVLHPAYQQIIGMGPDVIPLILREMQRRPEHWFWALNAISREDPIDPEDEGNIRKMTETWLQWGMKRGYIDGRVVNTGLPEST